MAAGVGGGEPPLPCGDVEGAVGGPDAGGVDVGGPDAGGEAVALPDAGVAGASGGSSSPEKRCCPGELRSNASK